MALGFNLALHSIRLVILCWTNQGESIKLYMAETKEVVVGILVDGEGACLLGQRPEHKPFPWHWEFPGGKVEVGEEPEAGLRRELAEELGIDVGSVELFDREVTDYGEAGRFAVSFYIVNEWNGEIVNNDFADLRWIRPSDFESVEILEGNQRICALLTERSRL